MNPPSDLEIFLAAPPGLEPLLRQEALALGFRGASVSEGGVTLRGDWPEVWRANLWLRGATRVLVRIGEMRVAHLAQLDRRARRLPWAAFLRPDIPVRVEATTKRSRIYHSGAAAQRIETAIREELGAPVSADADLRVFVRLDNNLCTVSVDTSGEPLHKRGFKLDVGKAPLRETLAALALRACGYCGAEPVLDPMCGSGTLVIEAAEIAAQLAPGRARAFAFEHLACFDAEVWRAMRADMPTRPPAHRFYGSDRDAGAIEASRANAARAGLAEFTEFRRQAISELTPPDGPPGLVIVNPPYGARIGEAAPLRALYHTLGRVLLERFSGWRVGLLTSEPPLAAAARLPVRAPGPPFPHGAIRVRLFQTDALP